MFGYGGTKLYASSKENSWDLLSSKVMFSVTVGEWVHWAVVRSGTSLKSYKNGTLFSSQTLSGSILDGNVPMAIGMQRDADRKYFIGYIDEFRISNIARWTDDFTPSTEPYSSPVPSTPSNLRLSSSTDTTATLAWDAVDGATGYKLYRDGVLIYTLTETSYTDVIQPFVSYVYTLTAYNDSGESDPATMSVQIIIPPEAPSNFRASSASMTSISLAWDAVTGAESYQLSRDDVVIYTGEYPSYTDRGLTADTAYTYTLSAVNTAGISAETTLEVATTQLILMTDRTAADVAAQNAKGTYNAADLNRVGEAMNYVADRLRAAGYDPHISPKTDWKDDDWVDQAAQAVYLGDLAELRKQFAMLESTPEVPPRILATGIRTNDGLTYVWANNIEQILLDIDALLTNIAAGWLYSGEIYSGEV